MKRNKVLIWTAASIVLVGAFLASRAFWFEPRSLTVREIDIQTPFWSGAPVRIALLSDVHGDNFHMPIARIKSLSASVASLKPDVILLGGDYVGGHFKKSGPPGAKRENRSVAENAFEREIILALGNMEAPLGVFAVMGNHDCWWDCDEVRRQFGKTDIEFLENRSFQVVRPSGSFWIVGVEDGQTQNPDFTAANQSIPPNSDVLTLVHNPGLFRWPTNKGAIQFSGHSHGGQVRFPVIGAPVRMSRFTEETVDEPYIKDGRILVVSTGLGEIGLPVRFGVPPEIVLVTVSKGATAQAKTIKRRAMEALSN